MMVVFVVLLSFLVMSVNFRLEVRTAWIFVAWLSVVVWGSVFTRLGVVMRSEVLRVLMTLVIRVSMEDVCSVVELCVAASQDVCTSSDHVLRKGKLLTVEDEEVCVFIEP